MVLGVLCFVSLAGLMFYATNSFKTTMNALHEYRDITEDHRPTNFAEVGRLQFAGIAAGQQSEALFEYRPNGAVTTTVSVAFDMKTLCTVGKNALPCMAMSTTYDQAFGNKLVAIEGIRENDRVVIHKLRAFQPGEQILIPRAGTTYVEWPDIVSALNACQVKVVVENQEERTVQLTFRNNAETWEAFQPVVGSLYQILDETDKKCGIVSRLTK
jgi:hypothetical protein